MKASKYGKSFRSVGRRIGFIVALPVIVSALFFGSAVAAEDEISVPFEEVLVADPGSVTEIANIAVEPRLVGEICSVSVNADNQNSIHPGNNLVTRSGTAAVVMIGIEDQANGKVVESQDIELSERLIVELVMGPEGISSLGFGVSILCNEDEPDIAPALQESEAPKVAADSCSTSATSSDGDCCNASGAAGAASGCCDEASTSAASECCGESDATPDASHCCDVSGDASTDGSVSSVCCAESNADSDSDDSTGCEKPTVLGTLQEAPTAKSVTKEPTYTG